MIILMIKQMENKYLEIKANNISFNNSINK